MDRGFCEACAMRRAREAGESAAPLPGGVGRKEAPAWELQGEVFNRLFVAIVVGMFLLAFHCARAYDAARAKQKSAADRAKAPHVTGMMLPIQTREP